MGRIDAGELTVRAAAREYGVPESVIYGWRAERKRELKRTRTAKVTHPNGMIIEVEGSLNDLKHLLGVIASS